MKEKQYTIGQIAKICNVSAEQLRHYDRQGILSPKGRGEYNGYRYYTEQQIEDIMLIKELKRIGLPLKSIGSLLKDKNLDQIKTTLESNMLIQRQQLYEHIKRYDSLVDTLLKLNNALSLISQSGENIASPVQGFSIVPIAERPILSTRYYSSYSVNDPFICRYAELQRIAETEHVATSSTLFLVFHDHYKKQFLKDDGVQGDLELFSNITGSAHHTEHCRMFGGFLAACATHIGHYRYTQPLYD